MYSNSSFAAKLAAPSQEAQAPQTKISINLNLNEIQVSEPNLNLLYCTPTPTRFIQDCEDVGLFLDLQNVNPFEEGFRKALIGKSHNNDQVGQSESLLNTCNESLHTPNILPIDLNVTTSVPMCSTSGEAVPCIVQNEDHTYSKKTVISNDYSTLHLGNSRHDQSDKLPNKTKKRDLGKRRETNRLSQRRAYLKRVQHIADANEQIETLIKENKVLSSKNKNLNRIVKTLRQQIRIIHDKIIFSAVVQGDVHDVLRNLRESMLIQNSGTPPERNEKAIASPTLITPVKTRFILPKLPNKN